MTTNDELAAKISKLDQITSLANLAARAGDMKETRRIWEEEQRPLSAEIDEDFKNLKP